MSEPLLQSRNKGEEAIRWINKYTFSYLCLWEWSQPSFLCTQNSNVSVKQWGCIGNGSSNLVCYVTLLSTFSWIYEQFPVNIKYYLCVHQNDIFFATTAPEFFHNKAERLQVDKPERDPSISPPSSPHCKYHTCSATVIMVRAPKACVERTLYDYVPSKNKSNVFFNVIHHETAPAYTSLLVHQCLAVKA